MTPTLARSRLFPYTTLFRSKILNRTPAMPFSPALSGSFIDLTIGLVHYITETTFSHASTFTNFCGTSYPVPVRASRPEEHTSELQSRANLVCRLLLATKRHC